MGFIKIKTTTLTNYTLVILICWGQGELLHLSEMNGVSNVKTQGKLSEIKKKKT